MTGEPINLQFTPAEFVEIGADQAESLFKLCAVKAGLTTETSIKYQVVCDSTAMVGMIKQKNKNAG